MTIDINRLFPRFILKDRNGYALAKAIEAGMSYAINKVDAGIATILDVSKMPEWRLDEMAKELGSLYDFNATVEEKRYWIENAVPLYAAYGTPKAILNYLEGMFEAVYIEENGNYSFGISVAGNLTQQKLTWLEKAVAVTKNVRSVFSGYNVGALGRLSIQGTGEPVAYSVHPRAGGFRAGADDELM